MQVPKNTGDAAYAPSSIEIENAMLAGRAWKTMLRHGDLARLDPAERKSLTSFGFGNTGWIVSPQWASTALSCLTEPTDLTSMVNNITISAPSIRYPIDNLRTMGLRKFLLFRLPAPEFVEA